MIFRITGRLPRSRGVMDASANLPRVDVAKKLKERSETVIERERKRREKICRKCDWFDGRCQHPACRICPGRQKKDPWIVVKICPAGRWNKP